MALKVQFAGAKLVHFSSFANARKRLETLHRPRRTFLDEAAIVRVGPVSEPDEHFALGRRRKALDQLSRLLLGHDVALHPELAERLLHAKTQAIKPRQQWIEAFPLVPA